MLRIAICDDNIPFTSEIESLLLQIKKQDYINMEIDIYFDGDSFCKKVNQKVHYDLIYMDIEMTQMDGIQAAHLLRSKNIPSLLIYISAYNTYFEKLFEVEPFRFIPKPIDFSKFYNYFQAAYNRIKHNTQFFTFSFHQKHTKIPIAEIIYLESHKRDILIHTTSAIYRFLGKLDQIEAYIDKHNWDFIRIHQSYIINSHHIIFITLSNVRLSNDCLLRVSPKFQKILQRKYLQIFEE